VTADAVTFWSRLLARRSVSPVLPAVETQPAGGERPVGRAFPPAERYPHPLLTKPDPWAAQHHDGSPDLETHPASVVEDFYASEIVRDGADVRAWEHLRTAAQSYERAVAVLRRVQREAVAQGLLTRATGGDT